MARGTVSIDQPVGIRNHVQTLPNRERDVQTIRDLLARLTPLVGPSFSLPDVWPSDRTALIAELSVRIRLFQTLVIATNPIPHRLRQADGAVDPRGETLRLMNALADEPPLTATVVDPPGGLSEHVAGSLVVADPASVPGTAPLQPTEAVSVFTRYLVRVDNSAIKWFAVAISDLGIGSIPHVFFTPNPHQGGFEDWNYETFGWKGLFDAYTRYIGRQVLAATSDQILVIPFYRNSQHRDLGSFKQTWKEVLTAVLTAAVDRYDPFFLRDRFVIDRMVTSSFSNGWIPHADFLTGAGVAAQLARSFDMDGVRAQPSSLDWRPAGGIKYRTNPPPANRPNPGAGPDFYVGGRFGRILPRVEPGGRRDEHALCATRLLFHAVSTFPA